MEAKDIDNKIWEVIQKTCGKNEVCPASVSKLDRVIFKAGIKEVVDNATIHSHGKFVALWIPQAKLKEWGIE